MKAVVKTLYETERDIITFDGSNFDRPVTFKELKQCDNVLLGARVNGGLYDVIIDDTFYTARITKIGCTNGVFYAIEVF